MSDREKIEVRKAGFADDADIDYTTLDAIVKDCGGWLRSSSVDGETAEVWHGDKAYTFSGAGLIAFLYGVKDKHVENLYAAVDLCDYIAGSTKTSPSVFVRDAIAARAEALKKRIEGGGS